MHRRISRLVCTLAILACASIHAESGQNTVASSDLQRRPGVQDETYPNVDVTYDAITDKAGRKLRVIVTRPHQHNGRLPTVFLVGWLSCVSVEAPPASKSPLAALFATISKIPGLVFVRMDKAGQGDSQGDCANSDFDSELEAYRSAFRSLKRYDFVDPEKIFVLGLSNGGGFAPLVPQDAPVRGYVVEGAWVKTWFEHMMEIERRRLALSGKSAGEVNSLMPAESSFYTDYLIKGESPAKIFANRSELSSLWDDKDFAHQYGRPTVFYQQLQKLNLAAAWSKVRVPVLVIHGEYDWIMSRDDHEAIAAIVNKNSPGTARFVELPNMAHGFDTYHSMGEAFADAGGALDSEHARVITNWLLENF